jgi:hypothetical protein
MNLGLKKVYFLGGGTGGSTRGRYRCDVSMRAFGRRETDQARRLNKHKKAASRDASKPYMHCCTHD